MRIMQPISHFLHFFEPLLSSISGSPKINPAQGAIIVASLFQVVVGYFGIVGLVLKYVTPLTIAPSVTMIGLSLFSVVSDAFASTNWAISLG